MGSGRDADGSHAACAARGTALRSSRPARRSESRVRGAMQDPDATGNDAAGAPGGMRAGQFAFGLASTFSSMRTFLPTTTPPDSSAWL